MVLCPGPCGYRSYGCAGWPRRKLRHRLPRWPGSDRAGQELTDMRSAVVPPQMFTIAALAKDTLLKPARPCRPGTLVHAADRISMLCPAAQNPRSDHACRAQAANFFKIQHLRSTHARPTLLETLLERGGPQFQFSIFSQVLYLPRIRKTRRQILFSCHASKTVGLRLKSSIELPVNGSSSRHGIG